MLELIRHYIFSSRLTVFLIAVLILFVLFSTPLYSNAAVIIPILAPIIAIIVVVDLLTCDINIIWGCDGNNNGGGGGGSPSSTPPPPPPTTILPKEPTFSASSNTINSGNSSTLSWSCEDSTSSSGVNFSTGGSVDGSIDVSPTGTTEYSLICSNGAQSSLTVTVLDPNLSITSSPNLIRVQDTATITWSAADVNSCTVSEDNPDFVDSWGGTSGNQTTSPITAETVYTVLCQTDGGPVSQSVTIRLIPEFQEF